MTITLHYCKNQKQDPNVVTAHEFKELVTPSDSCLCLIKWLLVWALRTGAVQATSWAELRQQIATQHAVKWTRPDKPVICAGALNDPVALAYDVPAPAAVLSRKVRAVCESTPALGRVKAYDLRRGAAFEVAVNASESQTAGVAAGVAAAAALLGHGASAVAAGVTKRYIGHQGGDEWGTRLKRTKPNERAAQRVNLATTSGNRARIKSKAPRLSPKDVEEACKKAGVDPKHRNSRRKIADRLKAEQDRSRREAANSLSFSAVTKPVQPVFSTNPVPAAAALSSIATDSIADFNSVPGSSIADRVRNAVTARSRPSHYLEHNGDGLAFVDTSEDYNPESDNEEDESTDQDDAASSNDDTSVDEDGDVVDYDPVARRPVADRPAAGPSTTDPNSGLSSTVNTSPLDNLDADEILDQMGKDDFQMEFMQTAITNTTATLLTDSSDATLDTATDTHPTPWLADANVFADYFAKINVYLYAPSNKTALPPSHSVGGSRDPPTRFWRRCHNYPACDYKCPGASRIDAHERVCKNTHGVAKPRVKCDNCGSEYKNEATLITHQQKCLFVPKTCDKAGCTDTTVWQTVKALRDHKRTVHPRTIA
ncbi:hypothetical protein FSARC_13205 [Fusarium sarcochroum]|uniref:C2H2-type domain-containing protein n=1 Tax=Fusarium sarcochroum TaxID=1208366 RepID=A0A8H4T344_9HYPO|nr:hypothetical protein FSARC_13205 [Fusarium sarcochroum]